MSIDAAPFSHIVSRILARLQAQARMIASAYTYGLTPEQYRERWGLSADYPMVAPAYAQQRSDLAKTIGLGTRRGSTPVVPVAAPARAKTPRARKAPAATTA
jgi:predicted transcriptional regulator